MVEGQVDDALGSPRPLAQAIEVFEVAVQGFGPGLAQRFGSGWRAGEAQHVVSGLEKFGNERGTDKAGGPGDEDFHGWEVK